MNPAMIATWIFGLLLAATPGVVGWGGLVDLCEARGGAGADLVPPLAGAAAQGVRARTATGATGATYRLMNEVPTLALVVIVVMVVVRPF